MLKAKISSFKADLSDPNMPSSNIFNPNSSDLYSPANDRTKQAA